MTDPKQLKSFKDLQESDYKKLVEMSSEISKMLEGLLQSVKRNALNSKFYILTSDRRGVAALVTIMTIMLFLVSVGFLVANVSLSSIGGGQNESYATEAQFLAEAGIQDALIRLARDADSTDNFTITDGSSVVAVAITTGSPVIITATSTIQGVAITVSRTIQAEVTIDADGKITAVSKTNL